MEKVEVLTAEQEVELVRVVDPDGVTLFGKDAEAEFVILNKSVWKKARNAVTVLLMLDAGLRVGEVVQLLYSDCYYARRPVLKLKIRAEIAKGGFEREVPLTRRLIFALARFHTVYDFNDEMIQAKFMITGAHYGKKMTTRGVEKFLEKVGREKLGIKLYPHMLRHTCATKLMRITDMATVQKILGHKHLSSTEVYTHPNSEDLDLAIKGMEAGCRPIREKPEGGWDQPSVRLSQEIRGGADVRGNNKGEPVDKPQDFHGDPIDIDRRQDDNSAGY